MGPFIYNPFAKKTGAGQDGSQAPAMRWIVGEKVGVDIEIWNPTSVEWQVWLSVGWSVSRGDAALCSPLQVLSPRIKCGFALVSAALDRGRECGRGYRDLEPHLHGVAGMALVQEAV